MFRRATEISVSAGFGGMEPIREELATIHHNVEVITVAVCNMVLMQELQALQNLSEELDDFAKSIEPRIIKNSQYRHHEEGQIRTWYCDDGE